MTAFDIIKLIDLSDEAQAQLLPALDALFFEASNTRDFTSDTEQAEFRETWLGRFLDAYPEYFYLARSKRRELLGYLAGAPDDPTKSGLFSDIEYLPLFKEFCGRYPAQLHINIASDARGSGIGRVLISAYTTRLQVEGVTGCHVITRQGAENIGFYLACGFEEIARVRWDKGDRTLVFLGKTLNQRENGA